MLVPSLAAALSLLLTAAPASNGAVELFVDKGDTFARAGTAQGLKVGTVLQVLGPTIGDTQERRRVGTATVMEVWESLARVALDAEAQKVTGPKFVELTPAKGKPSSEEAETAATDKARAPSLKGRVEARGPRIIVYNDSHMTWTNCDVRLPSNKRYVIKALAPNESEGIMPFRFVQDGIPRDVPTHWVNVKCEEGERRFNVR